MLEISSGQESSGWHQQKKLDALVQPQEDTLERVAFDDIRALAWSDCNLHVL